MKVRVRHTYVINVRSLSDYGKAKAVLEALEPLKLMHKYGYVDGPEEVTIWWETDEDVC